MQKVKSTSNQIYGKEPAASTPSQFTPFGQQAVPQELRQSKN